MNALHHTRGASAPAGDFESGGGSTTSAPHQPTLKQTARDAAAGIKSAATQAAHRAKDTAERVADDTRQRTAERVDAYGNAIHESAKSLEEKDPNIAWFTHRAADRLQGVADYVRSRDFAALRNDAEDIARRHPVALLGGLFVAGLVLGNLAKASGEERIDAPADSDDRAEAMMPDNTGETAPSI
jgi:hypothetical protein